MHKLIETAAKEYMPNIEKKVIARRKELEDIKTKIRSNPQIVEEWFDNEIKKIENINPRSFEMTKICQGHAS